jgi:hypothetical protein
VSCAGHLVHLLCTQGVCPNAWCSTCIVVRKGHEHQPFICPACWRRKEKGNPYVSNWSPKIQNANKVQPWRITSRAVGGSEDWADFSPQSSADQSLYSPCLVVDLMLAKFGYTLSWDLAEKISENLCQSLGTQVQHVRYEFSLLLKKRRIKGRTEEGYTSAGIETFVSNFMEALSRLEERFVSPASELIDQHSKPLAHKSVV